MLAAGMLVHNRYRIIRLLGQGGMGAVYLAEDQGLPGRRVALKENLDLLPDAQEQFRREAVMLARLRHPHLPQVTDYFIEPSGRQYLVMDFIDGEDLEQVPAQRGPLPAEATEIAAGVPLLPPRQISPTISVQVEQIILRAIQLRAADRYQNVRELRQALNVAMTAPTTAPMSCVCAACGATNRTGARFCAACGANLSKPGGQPPVISATAVDDLARRDGTVVAVIGQVTEVHYGQSRQGS